MSDDLPVLVTNHPVLVVSTVTSYDEKLCAYFDYLGLPSDRLFASVDDRRKVINNLPDAIDRLKGGKRAEAIYISKMAAACGAGLFDAGLTYLWDAVVASLRERVARFDLDYFYDTAVPKPKGSRRVRHRGRPEEPRGLASDQRLPQVRNSDGRRLQTAGPHPRHAQLVERRAPEQR